MCSLCLNYRIHYLYAFKIINLLLCLLGVLNASLSLLDYKSILISTSWWIKTIGSIACKRKIFWLLTQHIDIFWDSKYFYILYITPENCKQSSYAKLTYRFSLS